MRIPPITEISSAWRVLLTTVVVFIACGYGAALLNIYAQNELIDGRPGLSVDDLILLYSGGEVRVEPGEAPPSAMLRMIQGSMRQYFSDDDHYELLLNWLQHGAAPESFSGDDDLTPETVLVLDCMGCHASDSSHSISRTAAFGPTMFAADYEQVARFTTRVEPGQATAYRPPRGWRELAMSTHVHMLSVPVFVVLIAGLFLWATSESDGWIATQRAWLGAAPLVLFLIDVACWWLARIPQVGWLFALAIGASGALFGLTFLTQIAVVLRELLRRTGRQA